MDRKLIAFGLVAFTGAAMGFGLRAVTTKPVAQSTNVAGEQPVIADRQKQTGLELNGKGGASDAQRPNLGELESATGLRRLSMFVQYLDGAPLEEVIDLIELPWMDEPEERSSLARLVHLRAVEVDPVAWMGWIENDCDSKWRLFHRTYAMQAWSVIDAEAAFFASEGFDDSLREIAIRHLADIDPERAKELVGDSMPGSSVLRSIEYGRLAKLAESDRLGALEEALLLDSDGKLGAVRSIVLDWVESDPEAAWDWLGAQDGLMNAGPLARAVIDKMAIADPIAAQQKLATLGNSAENSRSRARILLERAKHDFESTLQSVRDEPDPAMRSYLLTSLADEFSTRDPQGFLQILRDERVVTGMENVDSYRMNSAHGGLSSSSARLDDAVRSAVLALARESPREALAHSWAYDPHGEDLSNAIVDSWVAEDAESAARWALNLEAETELAYQTQSGVMRSWAERSPSDAAEFLDGYNLGEVQDNLASHVAEQWVTTDPDAALQWARESAPEALAGALGAMARTDPSRAADEAVGLEAGTDRQEVISEVAQTWMRIDPAASSEWLGSLPAGDDVNSQINRATRDWTRSSPAEASAWLGGLEEGTRRDHAVAGLVQGMLDERGEQFDPATAGEWAETISDESIRTRWQRAIEGRSGGPVE